MTDYRSPSSVSVATPQRPAGTLSSGPGYHFSYLAGVEQAGAIALGMPLRPAPYSEPNLHPIFEMNLPEGYVLEQIRNRLARSVRIDPMLLLALTGRDEPIGRVRVTAPELPEASKQRVSLGQILRWDGAESLFDELMDRYAFRTGLAGVQPKVLVPEQTSDSSTSTPSLPTSDLIVKAGGDQYPGLAINEFVCMSIAQAADIPTPEFHLSDNRQLFVIRRFDRDSSRGALGFEDIAVLMGKRAADKYVGTYEQVARAIELYSSAVEQDLVQLFERVALSCIVGNGDAHLKNFGMLYTNPAASDARLSPAFDIVNTTAYIPEDGLALSLGGSKSLFASRLHILKLAQRCGIQEPNERIRKLLSAAESTLSALGDLLEGHVEIETAIRQGVDQFSATFGD